MNPKGLFDPISGGSFDEDESTALPPLWSKAKWLIYQRDVPALYRGNSRRKSCFELLKEWSDASVYESERKCFMSKK